MTLPVDYANATVSLDTHPDAHNQTNAAVNALDAKVVPAGGITGQILSKDSSDDYDVEWTDPVTAGDIIIDGAGVPSTSLGATGDYYLDKTNHVLYGPKDLVTAPAETLAIPNTPTTGGGDWELGIYVEFLLDGTVSQMQYQRVAGNDANLTCRAWTTGGVKIAEILDSRSGQTGTFTVTLPSPAPIAVTVGQTYVFSVGTTGGVPWYNDGASTPAMPDTFGQHFVYFRRGSSANVFPAATPGAGMYFYAQPIFVPSTTVPNWPVAVYGIPPGGTTGQFLKKTSATDYAVAWVT